MNAVRHPDTRQWSEAARWPVRVDEDIRAAATLVKAPPPSIGAAAFHCRQAAEKIGKAVLIALREPPPRIHDIAELGRLVRRRDPEIGKAIEELGGMTSWYASVRYPDAGVDFGPSPADVRGALSALRKLRRQVGALRPMRRRPTGGR